MFNTPVLFIIFNRPDTTARVFEVIKKIKPVQLFVAADGPRADKPGEREKCLAAREIIKSIDWPCQVRTLFKDSNVGPFWGPVSAISWFFTQVGHGIILEDDCLPHLSFFTFSEQLLHYYQENNQVMHISGSNFQFGQKRGNATYYFSKYTHVWGWATWRRAWQHYIDIDALRSYDKLELEKILSDFSQNKRKEEEFWKRKFYAIHDNKRQGIWDYQWNFTVWINNGLAIVPNTNLVSNIGFGKDATGTADASNKFANLPVEAVLNIAHTTIIEQSKEADDYTFYKSGYYFHPSFLKKLRWAIKRLIPKQAIIKLNKFISNVNVI